mgnify:CR=1 FL=1
MTPGIPTEPEVGGTPEAGSASSEGVAAMISGTVSVKEGQSGRIKIKGHLKDPRGQVHQPMGGAEGQATDIKIQAEEILRMKKQLNTILAKNTGQTLKKIEADTERDNYLTSKEAKTYGLIDSILTKRK